MDQATIVTGASALVYEWQNDTIQVRLTGEATGGLYNLTEDSLKPSFSLGLHLHRAHAETFHILDGEIEFRLGEETCTAAVGTTIHVPAGAPHAVRVVNGKPARMLMLFAPAGFDGLLKRMSELSASQFADPLFMKNLNESFDIFMLE